MACVTVMTFVLVSLACSSAADKGLRLKSYSKDEAKGCYKHNQTFGVCFDMKRGSMKIEKTTGEDIVHYQELGPDMFLYQVVDQDFIGYVIDQCRVMIRYDIISKTTDTKIYISCIFVTTLSENKSVFFISPYFLKGLIE